MIHRFTTIAGNTIFVRMAATAEAEKGKKRSRKENPTSTAVAMHNQKKAERDLSILLNYNFVSGDMHITLTFAGQEPTPEEARRHLDNFKKTLRRRYKKMGLTLKWIAVTEYLNERIHHHMIINKGLPIDEIARIWGRGILKTSVLDNTGDYRRLASYLIKETSKTFRMDGAVQRQRYSCSKTIKRPVTKREPITASKLFDDPKPIKGYYIDQDSLYKSSNPVTGQPCIEYVMVSLDAVPRLSIWPRGQRVSDLAGDIWIREHDVSRQIEIKLQPATAGIL